MIETTELREAPARRAYVDRLAPPRPALQLRLSSAITARLLSSLAEEGDRVWLAEDDRGA